MLGGWKLKIKKSTYDKVRVASQIAGCASIDEFAERVLERESDKLLTQTGSGNVQVSKEEADDIANKLKGLGYLE